MSKLKVAVPKGPGRQIQIAVIPESLGAAVQAELLRFLELSIGGKTDDYLRQLALRDASSQSIANTFRKSLPQMEKREQDAPTPALTNVKETGAGNERHAINGVFTSPRSILWPDQCCVRARFAIAVYAVHGLRRHLYPGTVFFRNMSRSKNGEFTLSFPEFAQVFKVAPTSFHNGKIFNVEVISVNSKTVELRLVEDISANGT